MNQSPTDPLVLAAEFPAASRADWLALVRRVIKNARRRAHRDDRRWSADRAALCEAKEGRHVAARTAPGPWQVMQRIDHPDRHSPMHRRCMTSSTARTLDLRHRRLGQRNGYGLDASAETLARALDGVVLDAGIAIDFNLSPPTRGVIRHFAALVKSRNIAPASVDMRASINPLGGFAAAGHSPQPWIKLAQSLTHLVRRAFRTRLSRAARSRGRTDHPQCGRFRSAGARVRDRQRPRLSSRL